MRNDNLARSQYSPTEPKSGVFAAARPLDPSSHGKNFSIAPHAKECAPEIENAARIALMEALVVLANAASRLGGGVR